MGKFIYKLESILTVKTKLEDQAKSAYAVEKSQLNQEEDKLQQLLIRKEGYETKLKDLVRSKLVLLDIKQCEDAIETMKYSIKIQQIVVAQAKVRVDKARDVMQKAMIERKTHEKLKENAFEEFVREMNQAEAKEIDQLNSFKYNNTNEDV